jgi:hypothetical protein
VQHVAAVSPDVAFVRGLNGNLWQFTAGSWRDTGLPMVGAAAVVQGALHAYDLFYRSPANRLMHAFPVGSAWEARDLGVVVLSDPAAASWGPGRFDVVSIDAAYRPIHWWSEGVAVESRVIASTPQGLAIGRPALVTSGPGRLHLFVQGRFDRALHAMQLETDMSWRLDVLPSTMLDAPGAVVDGAGNVRAYFRGGSNALWEVAYLSGAWVWTNVSSAVGDRLIRGTPSASISNGMLIVHAMIPTGLATFRFTDRWTVQEAVASLLGSPTSTAGAAHVMGWSEGLWLQATEWAWRGRPVQ